MWGKPLTSIIELPGLKEGVAKLAESWSDQELLVTGGFVEKMLMDLTVNNRQGFPWLTWVERKVNWFPRCYLLIPTML